MQGGRLWRCAESWYNAYLQPCRTLPELCWQAGGTTVSWQVHRQLPQVLVETVCVIRCKAPTKGEKLQHKFSMSHTARQPDDRPRRTTFVIMTVTLVSVPACGYHARARRVPGAPPKALLPPELPCADTQSAQQLGLCSLQRAKEEAPQLGALSTGLSTLAVCCESVDGQHK